MLRNKEIEHTADIGVEVYGGTREDLFQNAGYAFFNTIVNITTITPAVERIIRVTSDEEELLLLDWLRELLYLSSFHQEVYADFAVRFIGPLQLEACVKGELLDLDRHEFHTEIKAVTYHQYSVTYKNEIWQARVIFDV